MPPCSEDSGAETQREGVTAVPGLLWSLLGEEGSAWATDAEGLRQCGQTPHWATVHLQALV